MSITLLSSHEAAQSLGISVPTLYDWLNQSDAGTFQLRGQPITIEYLQGGARGQGRILLETTEIERLLALMRVRPKPITQRKPPTKKSVLQHITTKLGRPDE